MRIKINGEIYEVTDVSEYGYLPMIDVDGMEYYVAKDNESAGEAAKEYWKEMAEHDPKEFACMIGEETLVSWALGQFAGPGSTKVTNLEEWLDLWLDTPEEQWASYDGIELDVDVCGRKLEDELGFVPTVAYRHN